MSVHRPSCTSIIFHFLLPFIGGLFDPPEGEPLHKLGMQARSLDGKIEYMGGCAMMGQLTQVNFQLKDEWRDPVQSLPSNIDKG